MESILFITSFTCTITLTFSLFVMELRDTLSFETLIAVLDMSLIIGLTFAYFYLSERITTDLWAIGDFFYNATWYRLTAKRQTLFLLPVKRAQEKVRLTGLGLFECSLSVFATVCFTT